MEIVLVFEQRHVEGTPDVLGVRVVGLRHVFTGQVIEEGHPIW